MMQLPNDWSPGPEVVEGGGVGLDTGRVAMYLEGPWVMPRLRGELATTPEGINFDVIEAPTGEADTNFTFGHVHGHVITASSAYNDQSWDLIKFILSDEGQTIICQWWSDVQADRTILQDLGGDIFECLRIQQHGSLCRYRHTRNDLGHLWEGTQLGAYSGGPITTLWDKLLGQTETAEEALKIAQTEIQDLVDQCYRPNGRSRP
ncbi:MAG: hypothetical protein R2932_25895 [Caldilineaceae bacterium]